MGGLVFGEPSKWLRTNFQTGLKNGVKSIDFGKTRDKMEREIASELISITTYNYYFC